MNERRSFRTVWSVVSARILRPWLWRLVLLRRARNLTEGAFLRLLRMGNTPTEALGRFHEAARFRFFFHARNRKDFFLQLLRKVQDDQSILDEAEDVLHNRFETLGSGKVDLGPTINWQRDFKSGAEWSVAPSWKLDVLDLDRPSDVKVPWELSRFHQVWWLGKAYWLTGNEEYVRRFASLVEDWIDNNPPSRGVHWAIAMEPSIRACNWIAGYYFFCDSTSLSSEFWMKFLRNLYIHGLFIRNNLERSWQNSNHYLSNIVGLVFLGSFLRDVGKAPRWLAFAVKALEDEMQHQVYPDGVDYEKSTSYHRLVLEFFVSAALLCRRNRLSLSESFWMRLKKMFEFVMHYSRPDGSIPLVGDADDGRLFRFAAGDPINDHRGLLSVGAVIFECSQCKQVSRRFSQDALWLTGTEGFERFEALRSDSELLMSSSFPHGGFYVLHGPDSHVFVDAGDIGMDGRGGHGHNDILSFEMWGRDSAFVVDSGTYVYTADVQARQGLRGTRAHNTAKVDETEVAEFHGLWRIQEDLTQPRVLEWKVTDAVDILEAEHFAYRRLKNPVIHRRRFRFEKAPSILTVDDVFLGTGGSFVEIFLHFHPSHSVATVDKNRYLVQSASAVMEVSTSHPGMIQEGWYSPSYGIRMRNKVLCLALRTGPDQKISTRLSISKRS